MSEISSSKKETSSIQDILFGSIAGSIGKLIEYPFDTIKVRLQSQPHDKPPKFKGTKDCIIQTFKNEGTVGFYKGITSPIIGASLENATLFLSYHLAQSSFKKLLNNEELTIPYLIACGGISGGFASFVLTPVELLKCKLQVSNLYSKQSVSVLTLIQDIYKTHGIKGFWWGQTGTLIREMGGSASWFGVYEIMTRWLKSINGRLENTTPELLISGASAGIAYNISLFPADTIKSKMQTYSIINPNSKPLNFKQSVQLILKYHGISGFYKGLGITLIRAVPANAVEQQREKLLSNFEVYEHLKQIQSENNWITSNKTHNNDRKKLKKAYNPGLESITRDVISYLDKSHISEIQSSESITQCIQQLLSKFALEKLEALQIVNSIPRSLVSLFSVIEECDQRFSEEETQEILDIVNENFPFLEQEVEDQGEEQGEDVDMD
ncbi:hypothetical protein WICMUC_000557 [Wickerhamomyces mucosus]|uniref:DNA-directed RNA polymerase III subunit RPC9 n=1 Tax=Wickerhamomyces mucosus TaxID=1378264 RepID=A0A9P8PZI3_9ASCO|nr:hypothetical protein WICMUC_000557 [Wickerhamomyces mucosus]